MTIQEMKERKREMGLSNEEISRRSGVPVGTLQKILSGKTSSPRQQTIQALERVLTQNMTPVSPTFQYTTDEIRETGVAYGAKRQGEYTLEDYYAIPDERRVELIDGVIYDMSAPSVLHQKLLALLYLQFESCSQKHEDSCEVFLSPCDVQLDGDNKTMLQPDLFVLCRKYDLRAKSIFGAPDLTLEILSPSTRSKDILLKTSKYYHAGVREYWIVDPENERVIVYDFTNENYCPELYSFDDQIPIHISGGKCSINFEKIHQRLQ